MPDRTKKFQMEKHFSDGSKEEPLLYKIDDLNPDWKMDRRGLLRTTALGLTAITVLKSRVLPAKESKGKVKPAENPVVDIIDVKTGNATATKWMCFAVSLTLSGDEKLLATASGNNIKLWEIPSGRLLKSAELPHVNTISLNADGTVMAVGSTNCDAYAVLVYDMKEITRLTLTKVIEESYVAVGVDARFTGNGMKALFFADDGKTGLWDGRQIVKQDEMSLKQVSLSTRYNDDASLILYQKWDLKLKNAVSVRDVKAGKDLFTVRPKAQNILGVEFIKNFTQVAVFTEVRWLLYAYDIYDAADGKLLKHFEFPRNVEKIDAISITPDGSRIIVGHKGKEREFGNENPLSVVNTDDGKIIMNFVNDQYTQAVSILPFKDSNRVIVSYFSGAIIIYDLTTKGYHVFFDPAELDEDKKVMVYTVNENGKTIIKTAAENSSLPSGGVCTCNSVSGTKTVYSGGGSSCSCNRICTCVPVK